VGRAWGDPSAVGLAPPHLAPWPGSHHLYGAIGPCRLLHGPEAHLPARHTYLDKNGDGVACEPLR
jgi:hypothetical protein